jgi:hypothetical protein
MSNNRGLMDISGKEQERMSNKRGLIDISGKEQERNV